MLRRSRLIIVLIWAVFQVPVPVHAEEGDAPKEAPAASEEPSATGEDVPSSEDTVEQEELAPGGRPAMPGAGVDLLYPSDGVTGHLSMGAAFGKVGEDYYVTVDVAMVLAGSNWAIAPHVPLHFLVIDEEPKHEGEDEILRSEDWDEPSDFARLIAFAQYGSPDDNFWFRFGEFTGASVGHGTVINRYYNTIDIDHYQAGIVSSLDFGIVGGELLLDNVLDPELVLGRPFTRPLTWLPTLPAMLRNMKLGVTFGADFQAPLALKQQVGVLPRDEPHMAEVAEQAVLSFIGFDLEVPMLTLEHFDFVPYFDLNSIDTRGVGIHFGTFLTFRFSSLAELRTRIEYRLSGEGYDPTYVDPFYEVDRLHYRDEDDDAAAPSSQTKLRWLRDTPTKSRTGVLVEMELRLLNIFTIMASLAHDEGGAGQPPSNDLLARLLIPDIGPISISGFFAKLDFHEFADLENPKDSVVVGSVRYNITSYLFVEGRVVNEWWLVQDLNEESTYETTLNYDVGVGVLVGL